MPELKRALGLLETSFYGIGLILGAGIYALIGKAAGISGNAVWISFIFAAFIATLTALSYCELSAMFPKAGAEYVYVQKTFGRRWLSFLVGWLFLFTIVFGAAAVALGFGGYLSALLSPIVKIPAIIGASILVIVMTAVNLYGIEQSSKLNIIFTALEAFGLIFIIALGIGHFGNVNYLELPPGEGIGSIFVAAALIFFAYVGFEDIANIAEEVKKPEKTLPRAIVISVVVTTILYILVAISAISILDWKTLGQSGAPLADVAETALPGSSSLLGTIALFSTGNTVLILLITISRMLYGMAREGALPRFFSKVGKRKTPWISGIASMIIILGLIMTGNIRSVAEVSNFTILAVFISVNASLIYLRYSKPYLPRPFKVPLNIGRFPIIPSLGIAFSLFLMANFSAKIILSGIGIILLGLVVYEISDFFEHKKFHVTHV
ncbi:MAG: amino acid permease [Candidatus Aenigmarchaeota archaeon]|nr:amino acid permease [Candidatus Aenigmarchaeota archaeon]